MRHAKAIFLFILTVCWLIFGAYSFQYWWRKDHDLTVNEIPVMVVSSFFGPLTWVLGSAIHGEKKPGVIIFKQKE